MPAFLERQVELVAPDLVVLLGGAAAKHVLDVAEGIIRNTWELRDVEMEAIRCGPWPRCTRLPSCARPLLSDSHGAICSPSGHA